jgi:hypothetical protein
MWLRRLIRRPRKPSPLDPSALDRLEELITRVIELVPQAVGAREPTAQASGNGPDPATEVFAAEPPARAHLLLLPGYTLHERPGPTPPCGGHVEYDGILYTVLRQGPSPLPADRRRCAFLVRA